MRKNQLYYYIFLQNKTPLYIIVKLLYCIVLENNIFLD